MSQREDLISLFDSYDIWETGMKILKSKIQKFNTNNIRSKNEIRIILSLRDFETSINNANNTEATYLNDKCESENEFEPFTLSDDKNYDNINNIVCEKAYETIRINSFEENDRVII